MNKEKLLAILDSNNIEYREHGKNVSDGNINIKCPFCGEDPSFHLGISPEKEVFGCWMNPQHKGGLDYLLSKLLRKSKIHILEQYFNTVPIYTSKEETLHGKVSGVLTKKVKIEEQKIKGLSLPNYFTQIVENDPFFCYLLNRGFSKKFITSMSRKGRALRCYTSPDSRWNYRIIFPIYKDDNLVTWIGRTIVNNSVKYRNLGKEESILSQSEVLFNYDSIKQGASTLFIVEGILDALKLEYLFKDGTQKATCIFTKRISITQQELLYQLKNKYKEVILLLDKDAMSNMLYYKQELNYFPNLKCIFLQDVKDPGELSDLSFLGS